LLFAIAAFVGSLLAAMVLRAAAHWALRLEIEFWSAFETVFFAGLVNGAIGFAAGFAMRAAFRDRPDLLLYGQLAMLVVNFLVLSVVIRWRQELSFRQSLKVTLHMYLILLLIAAVAGAAVVAALYFAGLLRP